PLAVRVVVAFARLALPDALVRLSLIWLDLYQRAAPRAASDVPLRIVAIDDQSLNQIGQWPWPRGIVAQLVDKLRDAGAAVVVFDILFAEPDRTSPQSLIPILTAAGVGFVNSHLDWANVARREPLLLRLGDKAVPALPAEAVRVAVGARGYIVRAAGANTERGFGQNSNINAIKIGPLDVPTDAAGRVWLHYAPLDPGRYVSAAAILAGNFDPNRIAGHIVLVGATATGLGDVHATPLAADMPG